MSDQLPPMPGAPEPKATGLKGFILNHKVWSAIIALFVVGVIATAASPTPEPESAAPSSAPMTEAADPTEAPDPSEAPEPEPTEAAEPEFTVSQENAIESAKDYLEFSAFSEAGLIDQLSSKYGEGFPKADAVFAVKHIDVNWNEQAARSAKDYLDFSSFSCAGLIDQLQSKYGEQFTHSQAVYGANQTGLCS